jgi:hypothetical protein
MSDLIQSLTDLATYKHSDLSVALDARDEIERLRGLLRGVLDALGDPVHYLGTDLLDTLLRDLGPELCDTLRWYQTSAAYEKARAYERERAAVQPAPQTGSEP